MSIHQPTWFQSLYLIGIISISIYKDITYSYTSSNHRIEIIHIWRCTSIHQPTCRQSLYLTGIIHHYTSNWTSLNSICKYITFSYTSLKHRIQVEIIHIWYIEESLSILWYPNKRSTRAKDQYKKNVGPKLVTKKKHTKKHTTTGTTQKATRETLLNETLEKPDIRITRTALRKELKK